MWFGIWWRKNPLKYCRQLISTWLRSADPSRLPKSFVHWSFNVQNDFYLQQPQVHFVPNFQNKTKKTEVNGTNYLFSNATPNISDPSQMFCRKVDGLVTSACRFSNAQLSHSLAAPPHYAFSRIVKSKNTFARWQSTETKIISGAKIECCCGVRIWVSSRSNCWTIQYHTIKIWWLLA